MMARPGSAFPSLALVDEAQGDRYEVGFRTDGQRDKHTGQTIEAIVAFVHRMIDADEWAAAKNATLPLREPVRW